MLNFKGSYKTEFVFLKGIIKNLSLDSPDSVYTGNPIF